MPRTRLDPLTLILAAALAVAACGGGVERTADQQDTATPASGASGQVAAPDDAGRQSASESDLFEVRVTGPYFTGTQSYRVPISAIGGNFFGSATYLKTRATGGGPEDFLASGSDGSGLYRMALQIQGGGPGSYDFGNGTEMSLYLRNNGDPDPRCKQTAGPCTGVALVMTAGTFEVEKLGEVGNGKRVKLRFAGTFERTDTPGDGRDSYEVEGEADFTL